jgi:signal transduction histidine kinase/ActR/RegA family two-component response regulator
MRLKAEQESLAQMYWSSRYLFALLAVLAAAALRFRLDGVVHNQPFVTFIFAVLLVAAFAGSGPAVVATILSSVAGVYFFMEPAGAFKALSSDNLVRLIAFSAIGLSISVLTEARTRAIRAAVDAQVQAAEARNRQLAEEKIRKREEFLRGVLDSLPHEIAVIDAGGAILAINSRWECFARGNDGSVEIGANYLDVSRAAAEKGDCFAREALDGIQRVSSGDIEEFSMEYPCHAPDRERWFLMHAARAHCAPAAVVISHTDITERVRAERSRSELMEKLRESDRRKDEFLATLAHELRNPLSPIRNAVHVLQRDAEEGKWKARDVAVLEIADRQSQHLNRLVDDLLEVSRITRGKIELKKQPIDIAEALRNALDMARPSIERGKHTLDIVMPPEPLMVDGDPVRLAQLFANLLNNAAKYTDPGGRITLSAEAKDGAAVIVVRDNGVGIPKEMLPHVFDLFTQVDRTLGRAQGGIGVGLALVRRIAELHGGAVEAQSDGLGTGSAFTIRLPLSVCEPSDKTAETKREAFDETSARRVLVIDDERDVADSLVTLLETFGATVRAAYSGAEGTTAAAEFRPDLIFLDLGMPQLDGYETARRIRALPEGRAATLVALTGWGPDQIRERAREAGFDAELTKPATLPALRRLLADASPARVTRAAAQNDV